MSKVALDGTIEHLGTIDSMCQGSYAFLYETDKTPYVNWRYAYNGIFATDIYGITIRTGSDDGKDAQNKYLNHNVVEIKLTTPNFEGSPKYLRVSLKYWGSSRASDFLARYALCTSNSNRDVYINKAGDVSDVNQIISGAFVIPADPHMDIFTLTIPIEQLSGSTAYWLYLWPDINKGISDINENVSMYVEFAQYDFSTSVNTSTDSLGTVFIDDGAGYNEYRCHIDDGYSWTPCVIFVEDGTSWNVCG